MESWRNWRDRTAWLVFAVVFAIGGVTFAFAIHNARNAASDSACLGHIYYVASALHEYRDPHGAYPESSNGDPPHSWRVLILPQLGYSELYEQYNFAEPWNSPHNLKLVDQMPESLRCPHESKLGCPSYFLKFDREGRLGLVERNQQDIVWTEPRDFEATQPLPPPCTSSGRAYVLPDMSYGRKH